MHRIAIALLVSGLGLAAAPRMAHAQSTRVGTIRIPGTYDPRVGYPQTSAKGHKGNKAKREYLDANGCKVKEETKPNGDYKLERKCHNGEKNLEKAQRKADKDYEKNRRRSGDVYDRRNGGVYGGSSQGTGNIYDILRQGRRG